MKAYSHCTTLESEESTPSWTSSYMYSPVPRPRGVARSSYNFMSISSSSSEYFQSTCSLARCYILPPPPAPSPVPTDTSSMMEGLLHPRLGMALGSSQQASATSPRDHEDCIRPINRGFFFADKLICCWYVFLIIILEVRRLLKRKIPWIWAREAHNLEFFFIVRFFALLFLV